MEDLSNIIPILYNDETLSRLHTVLASEELDSWQNLWLWMLDILEHVIPSSLGETETDWNSTELPSHYLTYEESLMITDKIFSSMFGCDIYQRMLRLKTKLMCANELHFMAWILDVVTNLTSAKDADKLNEEYLVYKMTEFAQYAENGGEYEEHYDESEVVDSDIKQEEIDWDTNDRELRSKDAAGAFYDEQSGASAEIIEQIEGVEDNISDVDDFDDDDDDYTADEDFVYSGSSSQQCGSKTKNKTTKKKSKGNTTKPTSKSSSRPNNGQLSVPAIMRDKTIGVTNALKGELREEGYYGVWYTLVPLEDPSKPFMCAYCDFKTRVVGNLRRHIRKQHTNAMDANACTSCDRKFLFPHQLERHKKKMHEPHERVPCEVCGKRLSDEDTLRVHMKLHSSDYDRMKYQCEICRVKYFPTKNGLRSHINNVHRRQHYHAEGVFKCGECFKPFRRQDLVDSHFKRKHMDTGERFTCEYCQKSYKDRGPLRRHVRYWHLGLYDNLCDICGRTFEVKGALKEHRLSHGERSVVCDICGKKFLKRSTLRNHKLTVHQGEGRFKCSLCSKSFTSSTGLNNHMNSHTGEKPYECQVCMARFTQNSSLLTHTRKAHTLNTPESDHLQLQTL